MVERRRWVGLLKILDIVTTVDILEGFISFRVCFSLTKDKDTVRRQLCRMSLVMNTEEIVVTYLEFII